MQSLIICVFLAFLGGSQAYAYYGGPYGMGYTKFLCSPEDCISNEIKEILKACWTPTARKIWMDCMGEKTICESEEEWKINQCIYNSMENMTEITVREYRELKSKLFTYESLLECAGDKITLKMQNCTMAPRQSHYRPRVMRPRTFQPQVQFTKPIPQNFHARRILD